MSTFQHTVCSFPPATIELRKRTLVKTAITGDRVKKRGTFRVHVHVLARDLSEVEELRTLRDGLRTDAGLVAAYVARKREIMASEIIDSVFIGSK